MRLGAGLPKALVPVAGRPMLLWALDGALAADVDRVVVAAPPASLDAARRLVDGLPVAVVAGGATRQDSVLAALAEVPDDDVVLVHDAARPLTPAGQFDLVRAAVVASGAGVVPALTPADTIKSVDGERVIGTVDRSRLAAVQTPQGFRAGPLKAALAAADAGHTDDASAWAAAGLPVVTVPGDPAAFKITTRWDLRRAEQLLEPAPPTRTGLGIDVHAVDQDRPLRLGGLDWPEESGLAGHSDGDAVCHAIADALLSAGGLGDLGGVFGVDRPEEAGRAGLDFVIRAVDLLAGAGLQPRHVAVQVVALRPKLAPRRVEMEAVLAAAVGAPVSVAGTTTDGLGFTGRGHGLAAVATALVGPATPPVSSSA